MDHSYLLCTLKGYDNNVCINIVSDHLTKSKDELVNLGYFLTIYCTTYYVESPSI